MSTASPNYKNINRKTTSMDVLHYYTKEREHVKEELAKAPVHFSCQAGQGLGQNI